MESPSPAWILKPLKPSKPDHPSIISLEVFLDGQPKLRGAADEALGTDLSGTVSLNLAAPLPLSNLTINLLGARASLPSFQSSSSLSSSTSTTPAVTEEMIYNSLHELWHATPSNNGELQLGANDFRFMFKIPGDAPATTPGVIQYVLRVLLTDKNKVVADFAEEVRIRRVGWDDAPGNDDDEHGKGLPSYDGDEVWSGDSDKKTAPPPDYTDAWKGKGAA